jgi:hypothetical protein
VTSRLPVTSKAAAKMPLSLSRLPGCTALAPAWKLLLLFQSQNLCAPQGLSEPDSEGRLAQEDWA